MKRFAMTLGMLSMAFPMLAVAQTSTWVPDKAHSEVDFSILHMSLSKVHGRFGNHRRADCVERGRHHQVHRQRDDRCGTVDTGVAPRDTDLKSAGMFDVAQFPTATFASTSVAKTGKRPHRERQPDSAWRHQARGVAGRGSDWDRFPAWAARCTRASQLRPRSAGRHLASGRSILLLCWAMMSS